jgi:outer membrane protein OmpA-like peptidoglycan-associated protein
MRFITLSAITAGFWLALAGFGLAQEMDSGGEVRVNPLPPGGEVLLYPGGQYSRVVPPLLYPGEKPGTIQLHVPSPQRRLAHQAHPKSEHVASPAPKPKRLASAAPKPTIAAPKPKRLASAAPKPVPSASPPAPSATMANPFGGATDLSHVFGSTTPAPPPPKTAPAGPTNGNENLTKRSVIIFAKDAPDPAAGALGAIKFLAGDLNAAMGSPNARVELQAFGGSKGDKGSDARRLSLKRALAIRQVLIDDGVAADRIDVRAMGGADDTGPADRVDVYIKA